MPSSPRWSKIIANNSPRRWSRAVGRKLKGTSTGCPFPLLPPTGVHSPIRCWSGDAIVRSKASWRPNSSCRIRRREECVPFISPRPRRSWTAWARSGPNTTERRSGFGGTGGEFSRWSNKPGQHFGKPCNQSRPVLVSSCSGPHAGTGVWFPTKETSTQPSS